MNPNDMFRRLKTASAEERELILFVASYMANDRGIEDMKREILAAMGQVDFDPRFLDVVEGRQPIPGGDSFRNHYGLPYFEQMGKCFCTDTETGRFIAESFAKFKKIKERTICETYYQTNVGGQVWKTLDWCLKTRRAAVIEGLEGRGKSATAKAWFEAHRGAARYVSLSGMGVQRDFFAALADAYGASTHGSAPNQISWKVRDAIVRSECVLILDEAHFALPDRHSAGRARLIDWIDTELCNAGVPVALVTTLQFAPRLAEFQKRTGWNANQFWRRFAGRWCKLPDATEEAHLRALAEQALPNVGPKGVNLAVGYALGIRDVSGLFDLVNDAWLRASEAGHAQVTLADLKAAYELDRLPAENALAAAKERNIDGSAAPAEEDFEPETDECSAAAEPLPSIGNRLATPNPSLRRESARGLVTAE